MSDIVKILPILGGITAVTFISGYAPNLGLSKKFLNLVAVFGGGVLIGAALLVVMPEACKVMVENNYETHKPMTKEEIFPEHLILTIGISVMCGFYTMLLIDEFVGLLHTRGETT